MPGLPGGKLAGRPLHFIWIADCSYSMAGEKIKSLNEAIRESLPHMRKVAEDNPNAEVLIRAIKFSSGAEWHIGMPTAIDQFQWDDLSVESSTDLGAALSLLADALKIPPMDTRALPPVLVLLSDGMPTDDYKAGLNKLMAEPWGKRSVRIAIAIGSDADLDVLKKFIANPELEPLVAKNSPQLVKAIRWASTAVLQAASAPASQGAGKDHGQGALPPPPPAGPAAAEHDDVW
jgi:uncharacterized protein YegL